MKIGVICAMEEELTAITQQLQLIAVKDHVYCNNNYCEYQIGNNLIFMVVSGIGKVNAAVTTQVLVNKFNPDKIINLGVAGSLNKNLTFGDVVIADDLVQHDFDTSTFGMRLGQIARMDIFAFPTDKEINQLVVDNVTLDGNQIVKGRIVSGDQFIDDKAKSEFLAEEFGALACEMEGAAIAHVCYLNNIPVAIIRSLSDMAGQDGKAVHSFNELKDMAASRAAQVFASLLRRI